MNTPDAIKQEIRKSISFLFDAYAYGFGPVKARTYWLYNRRHPHALDAPADHTEEEVDAFIEAVERVNQRWPGAFIPVTPPRPRPADRNQVIWILDCKAFWITRLGDPTPDEFISVALGEASEQ